MYVRILKGASDLQEVDKLLIQFWEELENEENIKEEIKDKKEGKQIAS